MIWCLPDIVKVAWKACVPGMQEIRQVVLLEALNCRCPLMYFEELKVVFSALLALNSHIEASLANVVCFWSVGVMQLKAEANKEFGQNSKLNVVEALHNHQYTASPTGYGDSRLQRFEAALRSEASFVPSS